MRGVMAVDPILLIGFPVPSTAAQQVASEVKSILEGGSSYSTQAPTSDRGPQRAVENLHAPKGSSAVHEVEIFEQSIRSKAATSLEYFSTYEKTLISERAEAEFAARIRGAGDDAKHEGVRVEPEPKRAADGARVGQSRVDPIPPSVRKSAIHVRKEQVPSDGICGAAIDLRRETTVFTVEPDPDLLLEPGHGPARDSDRVVLAPAIDDDQLIGRLTVQHRQKSSDLARFVQHREHQREGLPTDRRTTHLVRSLLVGVLSSPSELQRKNPNPAAKQALSSKHPRGSDDSCEEPISMALAPRPETRLTSEAS